MDPFSSSLQVQEHSQPGPSRQQAHRPVSVQPMPSSTVASVSSRKRASHTVTTSQPQEDDRPTYRDIYSHPAALEYAAAHPRRTIPKFGPYLLLQTLGEGEFGKVKLGLHMQWGEEVAVKLIRRGNIDSSVRMSKVEREIEVLRTLKHPNIVRLYDVIETDKYIGIILEYASGGELFDHILAHRYLREKDACKLFSQLISGVWYIHQKKIVHRDLKLENLLLDRHRNVIITDFGFANRFEHRADDLMQTSCGSPCYAAPELVISDGLYVGSAVDIWSCGVILYAMLAGYLPFDDDPQNPDGDNINLLYKYIVNTPLSFPDYISADARDLLSMMLVPDPVRRADLPSIMAHKWLTPYAHVFSKSVEELERAAIEQHHQKRLQYQRQMRQSAAEPTAAKMSRSHSARTDVYIPPPSSARVARQAHETQPEFLYETSTDQQMYSTGSQSSRRGTSSAIVLPTSSSAALDDDPFASTPTNELPSISIPTFAASNPNDTRVQDDSRVRRDSESTPRKSHAHSPTVEPVKMSPDGKRAKNAFRHTIQVEYGESDSKPPTRPTTKEGPSVNGNGAAPNGSSSPAQERERPARRPSVTDKPLPGPPQGDRAQERQVRDAKSGKLAAAPSATAPPVVSIEVTGPPVTPVASKEQKATHVQSSSGSTDSASSNKSRHRKGLSIDKIGISRMFSTGSAEQANSAPDSKRPPPGRVPSTDTVLTTPRNDRRPSTLQVPATASPAAVTDATASSTLLSPDGSVSSKNRRRNTLTIMVERATKPRGRKTAETPVREKAPPFDGEKTPEPAVPAVLPTTPHFADASQADMVPPAALKGRTSSVPASTMKASRVMQWFRSKSKGRGALDDDTDKSLPASDVEVVPRGTTPSSSSTAQNGGVQTLLATPSDKRMPHTAHPQRSASGHADMSFPGSLADRVRGRASVPKNTLRVHHGAVDTTMITTGSPPEVMKHVRAVLEGMGMEIQLETDYKYRCVRPKRRKAGTGVGLGLRDGVAAFTMSGSAASNGVDKRGLPLPSQSSFSSGGMLRGLLMRRQSSQVSASSLHQFGMPQSADADPSPDTLLAAAVAGGPSTDVQTATSTETIYGDTQQDQGDEVRFSVELTRIDRLDDTYSLDIRRLKGNLRSYKFLYDTLRQRADLHR
ncbi:Pkinase-domain-containing protein [Obba rivulosa]|uniref:non-specific serine/threonine protein kinase n=1 Tax=Obba rivulosa TaxID=1052685 RepID=A0A8E2APU0_9APHY|nr:Pkinase-domain-containing protein [Obba rivulosa]